MATVTEKVKESLVGANIEPTASESTRAEFLAHAVKDEETGEYYMGHKEFIDAVAPEGEDYVRIASLSLWLSFDCEGRREGRRQRGPRHQREQHR